MAKKRARRAPVLIKVGRKWRKPLLFLCSALVLILMAPNLYVSWRSANQYSDQVDSLAPFQWALVLGCSPKLKGGKPNPFFESRMDACLQLYRAGKVQFFILSGDNLAADYNEPALMRDALLKRGIPAEKLVLDGMGIDTYKSLKSVQSKNIGRVLIVSQAFHSHRALTLAYHLRLDAYAFDAPPVGGLAGLRLHVRETFARWKMLLDVFNESKA